MSPKRITHLALILAVISIMGTVMMLVLRPAWGVMNWWPAMGLGLAWSLLLISFLWGAYLSAQHRAAMVDKLNDCYTGVTDSGDPAT